MVFAKKIFDGVSFVKIVIAVVLFCVLISCVYMSYDVIDIKNKFGDSLISIIEKFKNANLKEYLIEESKKQGNNNRFN